MADDELVPRLRMGEDPDSEYPGDAYHWVGVYSELLHLAEEAARELEAGGMRSSRADVDGCLLLFRERLAFWQDRTRHQAEARSWLGPAGPQPSADT
jgi:hypothetical protein